MCPESQSNERQAHQLIVQKAERGVKRSINEWAQRGEPEEATNHSGGSSKPNDRFVQQVS